VQQRAMQSATGGFSRAAMANAAARGNRATTTNAMAANAMAANAATAGYSQADIDAMLAFQQEMTRLSAAASTGDASAQVRLAAWEALVLRNNPEMQRLSMAASAGDMGAVQKLERLQFDMMREWVHSGSAKAPARVK